MSLSLHFRAPEFAETPTLSSIALSAKAMWGYDETFMAACRDELSVTPADLENPSFDFELAETNGEIAGFCTIESLGERRFELEALFVVPNAVRRGIGRQLVERAIARIRESGGGVMFVQSDPNAADFYQRCGAVQVGERESNSVPGRLLPLFEFRIDAG